MGRSKMQDLADERGQSVEDLLTDAYAEHGSQIEVAAALGVSQTTISTWLARLRLKPKVILVRDTINQE